MGASKSKEQDASEEPPQAVAQEDPPYPGPSAQYHFINTDVVIGTKMSFGFMNSPMVTSDIDTYYPLLAAQLAEGYRLLSFYRIPGQQQLRGFSTAALGFQGIFCRYPTAPRRQNWKLRVEKSVIQLAVTRRGVLTYHGSMESDKTYILDGISRNTQDGGRLVCLEMTGQQESRNMREAMQGLSPVMGVDLFFEVPDTPGAQQYVYHCVDVPINVTVQMGVRPTPTAHCDWMGILASNLNQGWRLVEIFKDKGLQTQARGNFSSQVDFNSIWFFEKPASRINDPTPVYEGTVIDHSVKLKTSGFGSVNTTTRWEPVIQTMGNRGWELACILELPEWYFTGFATAYMKCKLFFQRPILPQVGATALPSDLPPPYDIAVTMFKEGGSEGRGLPPDIGFQHPCPSAPSETECMRSSSEK